MGKAGLAVERYVRNCLEGEKGKPRTRAELLDCLKEVIEESLATQALDDMFREELLMADNDGLIRWVPED